MQRSPAGESTEWLALLVIIATLAVLSIALIISVLDMRLESRTAMLAASLAEANQELTYLALHDNLTKLPNRVLLEDRLDQTIQDAAREHSRFLVMFLDLDVSRRSMIPSGTRSGIFCWLRLHGASGQPCVLEITIARIGGDEFVLLADGGEPAHAASLADS